MQVKIIGGAGLHASEVKAIKRMESELRDSWFCYAGLMVSDPKGTMEIDALIITHDRVLLVELKEWNGILESEGGYGFKTEGIEVKVPMLSRESMVSVCKRFSILN